MPPHPHILQLPRHFVQMYKCYASLTATVKEQQSGRDFLVGLFRAEAAVVIIGFLFLLGEGEVAGLEVGEGDCEDGQELKCHQMSLLIHCDGPNLKSGIGQVVLVPEVLNSLI